MKYKVTRDTSDWLETTIAVVIYRDGTARPRSITQIPDTRYTSVQEAIANAEIWLSRKIGFDNIVIHLDDGAELPEELR